MILTDLQYRNALAYLAHELLVDLDDPDADARDLAERTRQLAGLIVAEIDDAGRAAQASHEALARAEFGTDAVAEVA